jgi:acetyl-CoA carboxylase carboxyl transferase subunit beta
MLEPMTSSAEHRLNEVLDPGWVERDADLATRNPLDFPGYKPEGEAAVTASGAVGGFPVEAISFSFEILGGSMGVAVGEKIARSFERAVERRAGVVALVASGGARLQEGMLALAQMAKTVVARGAATRAGLPFIAYLRNPTTGGVYASFASLADLLWAEPGATIGFAGPRVAEAVTGRSLPEGSHTSEFALARGLVDDVVSPEALRGRLRSALDLTLGADAPRALAMPDEPAPGRRAAWEEVTLARHPDRPTGAGFLHAMAEDVIELRGDRAGVDDRAIVAGIARIAGWRVAVLAHDRRAPRPPAYRKSYRLVRMAAALGLPLVTFVDTPGADPSSEAESGGIARSIATAFRTVLDHPTSTIAVVTGEGGSGGALAFAACDRLFALEHAIFSVIAPEGAAAILRRTDVAEVAEDLRLTAHDLRRLGLADRVLPEPGAGAHVDARAAAAVVEAAISSGLAGLPRSADLQARRARWRRAGNGALGA